MTMQEDMQRISREIKWKLNDALLWGNEQERAAFDQWRKEQEAMTLRERIDATIMECVEIDDDECIVTVKVSEATPAILALFQDAMLSDEAVDAVMRYHLGIKSPYGRDLYRDDARAGMAAALDATLKDD